MMDELADALFRHGAVGGGDDERAERFPFGLGLLALIPPRADGR